MWWGGVDTRTPADAARGRARHGIVGERNEDECPGPFNSGMFNAILERGDVKGVFVGHDHVNDYYGNYYGVLLGYAPGTGFGAYGLPGADRNRMRGGRVSELTEAGDDVAIATRARLRPAISASIPPPTTSRWNPRHCLRTGVCLTLRLTGCRGSRLGCFWCWPKAGETSSHDSPGCRRGSKHAPSPHPSTDRPRRRPRGFAAGFHPVRGAAQGPGNPDDLDGHDVPHAVNELDDVIALVEAEGVTVRGFYDVSGLRADADVMIWLTPPRPRPCSGRYRELRRTRLLKSLLPTWNAMGVHRDAEFNKSHVPGFLRGIEPKGWLTVYPFVRSYEWYLLPEDERRKMLADHGRKGAAFRGAIANTVAVVRPRRLRVAAADRGRRADRAGRPDARPARHRGPPPRARRGPVLHGPPHPSRARPKLRATRAASSEPDATTPSCSPASAARRARTTSSRSCATSRAAAASPRSASKRSPTTTATSAASARSTTEPRAQGRPRGRARPPRHRPAGDLGQPQLGPLPAPTPSPRRTPPATTAARHRHQRLQLVLELPPVPRGLRRGAGRRPASAARCRSTRCASSSTTPASSRRSSTGVREGLAEVAGRRPRHRPRDRGRGAVLHALDPVDGCRQSGSGRARASATGGAYAAQHLAVAEVVMAGDAGPSTSRAVAARLPVPLAARPACRGSSPTSTTPSRAARRAASRPS